MGPKKFMVVWRCHQLLSGFLTNSHLSQVSRQSRLSTVHKSPDINSGKPQLGERTLKAV